MYSFFFFKFVLFHVKIDAWLSCKNKSFYLYNNYIIITTTNKWYMHNPAPVLENATHKLLWGFNIKMDHLIPTRKPDLIIINNKKKKKREFAKLMTLLSRYRIKLKECEKKDKYLDLARELKKLLRTARILRRVLDTWGDLLSLKLQWKTIR